MTNNLINYVKKNSEYAINDNSIKEVLSSKQKRFLNKLEFSNVEYDLIYDCQEYLKQKVILTTKEDKKVNVYLYVAYDIDKQKHFVDEKNSNILSKINDAVEDYNEHLEHIKKRIRELNNYYEITMDYKEETLIKLLNAYDCQYIRVFIDNYYKIASETNTLLTLEQLVDTLDLF